MSQVSAGDSGAASPVGGGVDVPTPGVRSRPSAGPEKLSGWLWYDRSVRWQLLATFLLIDLLAGAASGAIVIYNAHKATMAEIAASMELAERFVRGTVDELAREPANIHRLGSPLHALEDIVRRVRNLRHVRIVVTDTNGRQVSDQAEAGDGTEGERAPPWFAALFQFGNLSHEVPVTLGGRQLGTVVVMGQPADEIAEVWRDVSDLAAVVLTANIVVLALFYLALGRVLQPLTSLAQAMQQLEQGRFRYRLSRPRAREFASIVDRFNSLASALDVARSDNNRLNRRLVTAHDDERRQIATELHDELGACLFGLRANVMSLQRQVEALPPALAEPLQKRIATLAEVSERIQTTNRSVLRRIRPMAIGHAPLADAIGLLVADFQRNDPDRTFTLHSARLKHAYGESIDLTVYRCAQEALTNAVRHAEARSITVTLEELTPPPSQHEGRSTPAGLRLSVSDDGRGFAPRTPHGLGLTSMEERVRALGGMLSISSRPGGGSCLDIVIPVEEQPIVDASAASQSERK